MHKTSTDGAPNQAVIRSIISTRHLIMQNIKNMQRNLTISYELILSSKQRNLKCKKYTVAD